MNFRGPRPVPLFNQRSNSLDTWFTWSIDKLAQAYAYLSALVFNSELVHWVLCWPSCRIFNATASEHSACTRLDTSGWATLIATQVGFGGTLGFLLGYGLKKVATIVLKILALVAGLFTLGLTWLASIGVVTVNLNAFTSTMENSFAGFLSAIVASLAFAAQILPIGGSFGLGFYLGAKKG